MTTTSTSYRLPRLQIECIRRGVPDVCWVEWTVSVEADDQTQPASRSSFLSGVVISDWRTLRAFDHLLSDVYPSLDWLIFNAPLSHVSCPRALSTDRLGHRERNVPRLYREGSESYSCDFPQSLSGTGVFLEAPRSLEWCGGVGRSVAMNPTPCISTPPVNY